MGAPSFTCVRVGLACEISLVGRFCSDESQSLINLANDLRMTIKQLAKHAFTGTAQTLLTAGLFGSFVDRLAYERLRQRRRQVEQRLKGKGLYGDVVERGPFKGMAYTSHWAKNRFEKIIGAYEFYLHGFLERICARQYSEVVDVGCAEGYYAVGLARRMPQTVVYAYDNDAEMIEHCLENAQLNRVRDQVRTGAFCEPSVLQNIPIRQKGLVFSDCEGYELTLLDPAKAPMLMANDILVEIHDFKDRAISTTIRERFSATHTLEVVRAESVRFADYPVLQHLNLQEIYAMVAEERVELREWYYLQARSDPP